MYALHARQLQTASTQATRIQQFDMLLAKLRDKVPAYQEFEANFRTIVVSEKWIDDFLEKQTSLGHNEIRKRTDHLAKLAFDRVWRV